MVQNNPLDCGLFALDHVQCYVSRFYQHACPIFAVDSDLRGDKEADQNSAGVADEEDEQSKHFDEEAGLGNPDQKKAAGSQKTGDISKYDLASTSATEKVGGEPKNRGKDTLGKKF
ncbi:unnamed protein product [Ilex paraguariensis]|uniref:Ubiquitin-like protease family profile domain-containing protein n=1 Tax=Ilex paraguariensis TaxID=185542 RepID=A0ABC8UWI4_9AQUA